jgi:hypothetical protein
MLKNKKAQISIEIIIIIVFIIVFLYIFNNLAEDTVRTLEFNEIKNQQKEIALSLNEFLKLQESIVNREKLNIIDYNSTMYIPEINVASQKVNCLITIDQNKIIINTQYDDLFVSTDQNVNLSNTDYNFTPPISIYCGQPLVCKKNNMLIECR